MGRYYDREGQPLSLEDWAVLFDRAEDEYRRVGWDELPDGRVVSTVWLGLDHRQGRGPPLIFETMVGTPSGDGYDWDEEVRYSTLEEARAGHRARVLSLAS